MDYITNAPCTLLGNAVHLAIFLSLNTSEIKAYLQVLLVFVFVFFYFWFLPCMRFVRALYGK